MWDKLTLDIVLIFYLFGVLSGYILFGITKLAYFLLSQS